MSDIKWLRLKIAEIKSGIQMIDRLTTGNLSHNKNYLRGLLEIYLKESEEQANGFSESHEQALHKHIVMPRISYFIDENGNNVDLNAEGVSAKLKKDGTFEYYRSFGFAGRKKLTPVYGA